MLIPRGCLLILGLSLALYRAVAFDEATGSYFPSLRPPKSLLVAKTYSGGLQAAMDLSVDPDARRAEYILLESMAGLLLKKGHNEGIFIEPNIYHHQVLQELSQRRRVPFTYVAAPATVWSLVDRFKTNFGSRYVRCSLLSNPASLSIARMVAHKYDGIIVDEALESAARKHGLTNAFDATTKNDPWFLTNWWPQWPIQDLALEQNNDPAKLGDVICMNDYSAATGVPVFFEGTNSGLRSKFLQGMKPDSVLLGWPLCSDELTFTAENSRHNVSLAAANWCFNLALLSSFRQGSHLPLQQAPAPAGPPTETKVHYVTFVFTDGDNVQWFHNGFLGSSNWWGSPKRGQVPLGWGISPTLRDLSPTIVETLYDPAEHNGVAQDHFCAMSPIGYCYPSLLSAQTRATNARRLERYMQDLGLSILIVLDKSGFENEAVYQPYLAQPAIRAIFYWDAFGDYAKYAGAIRWVNDKPIISAFATLWGSKGPTQVAAAINQRPATPFTASGYSMIAVHAWSHTVEDVHQCVQLLGPQVRVVTPATFVDQLRRNTR